jgi:hypothetical protein
MIPEITLAKSRNRPDNDKYILTGLKGATKICFKANSCASNVDNDRAWRVGEYLTEAELDRLDKEGRYLINLVSIF